MAINDHTPQRGQDPSDATRPVDAVPVARPDADASPAMEVLATGRHEPTMEIPPMRGPAPLAMDLEPVGHQPADGQSVAAPAAGGPQPPGGPGSRLWSRVPGGRNAAAKAGPAVAGVVLLVAASFAGGYVVGQSNAAAAADTTEVSTQTGQAPGSGGAAPGQGPGGFGGFGGGAGQDQGATTTTGAVAGRIAEVAGDSFTLTTAGGQVTVTTSDETHVSDTLGGSVGDLAAGQLVIVRGAAADDGTVAAAMIITPAGLNRERNGTTSSGGTGDDLEESQ
jgi:hypothetical protein